MAALVCFLIFVPTASAADHCVGSHPLCSSGNNYPATKAGIQDALAAANNSGAFAGPDRIFVEAGQYPLTTSLGITASEGDIELIGEGDATWFSVDANNITGLNAQGSSVNDLLVSNLRVRMIGWGAGYALFLRNATAQNITLEVTATSGNVRALNSRDTALLVDSTLVLTGNGVGAGYTEDDPEIRDTEIRSVDGNSYGFALSDQTGTLTVRGSTFENMRRAVETDVGSIDVRDTYVKLSSVSGASGITAENGNECDGCDLSLFADNVTVIGTGPNQAGIGVGGTAANLADESGVGIVSDSLLHLTGSGSEAMRCHQSGTNTSASLNTSYVAAEIGRIARTGGCTGSDSSLLNTTSNPPVFNFPAVGDYRPKESSPVVDASEPDQFVAPGAKDVDGLNREEGTEVDIGAHEFQAAMRPSPIQYSASPNPADVGELIQFDAESVEPDDGAIGYHWDFGDGNSDTDDDPQHSYAAPGDYTVTVTASDDELDETSSTFEVHISSDPPSTPTVEADKDFTFRSEAVTFTASGSTDAGGGPIEYEWKFTGQTEFEIGDAVVARAPTLLDSPGPTIYTATVRAVGEFGERSPEVSVNVPVFNHLPSITAINVDRETAFRGEAFEFSADGDDAPENDVIFRSWDFGDGFSSYTNDYYVTRAFDTVGVKTVKLKMRDGYFAQAGPDEVEDEMSRTVEVLNREPTVGEISHGGSSKTSDPQTFSVTATEPEGDPLTYAWSFGDGQSGSGASVSHAYSAPGTYNVVVVVSDGQGASIVKQLPLTIASKRARVEIAKPTKNFKSVKLTSSEAVGVTFTVLKTKAGFRKGSRCVKKGAGKRCDLKLAGSLKKKLAKGTTSVSFRGKWRGKKLPKGSYKLVATPSDGGPAVTVPFRVR